MNSIPYRHTAEEIKDEMSKLPDDANNKVVEETASRLESINYAPPIITPMEKFLRIRTEGMLKEVERILNMSAEESCSIALAEPEKCRDIKLQSITILLYYYKKLLLLRAGNTEEWDEVGEMYVYD